MFFLIKIVKGESKINHISFFSLSVSLSPFLFYPLPLHNVPFKLSQNISKTSFIIQGVRFRDVKEELSQEVENKMYYFIVYKTFLL